MNKFRMRLIVCDRSALEREIVEMAWTGTNEQLRQAIAKLMPRGQLRLCWGRGDEGSVAELTEEPPPLEH